MKKVYAYIRVSTVKQGMQGSSLAEQKHAIETYAQQNNLTISKWFEEKETAAKNGRTIFNNMLRLLVRGSTNGVIIHKIDRGARNLKDWADLGELIDKGVEVHFAHESLDMNSRGGRLAADIQAVVAADFIRNLRDEIKKGFKGRLRQGLYPLPAPLGYDNNGRGMPKTPNPEMAPLVKKAFELYATGEYNLFTLGNKMYSLGLRNRSGTRVTRNGLSKMLNNEFYFGLIYIESLKERYQGIHTPIIKKVLFDKVQEVLSGRIKNRKVRHTFKYRKALRCKYCRYNYTAEYQKGISYYRCQTRDCPGMCVREEIINGQVKAQLEKINFSKDILGMLEKEFSYLDSEQETNMNNLLASAELALSKLDTKIANLIDAYIDKLIDKESFEERNQKLLYERSKARELLASLQNNPKFSVERSKEFFKLLREVARYIDLIDRDTTCDLLKTVTSNLEMDGKKLVFTWSKPFGELYEYRELINGEPPRTTTRKKSSKFTKLIKRLYKIVQEEDGWEDWSSYA